MTARKPIAVFACGQESILGESCLCCGGWVNAVRRGGFVSGGWRYCSEDCIADQQEFEARIDATTHLGNRDMLCDCAEVCAPRGLPTQADRDEWAAYLATPFEDRR